MGLGFCEEHARETTKINVLPSDLTGGPYIPVTSTTSASPLVLYHGRSADVCTAGKTNPRSGLVVWAHWIREDRQWDITRGWGDMVCMNHSKIETVLVSICIFHTSCIT